MRGFPDPTADGISRGQSASPLADLSSDGRVLLHKELSSTFSAESAGAFDSPSSIYFWARKRSELRRLVRRHHEHFAGLPPLFVDIGCGNGRDLFVMRDELPGWDFLGLDIDAGALRRAELRREFHHGHNIRFLRHDVTARLPLGDGEAGVTFSSEVVEHLLEPDAYLAETRRVTATGGYLLFTTPNQPNVFQRSWWSKRHHERMLAQAADGTRSHDSDVTTHGHVSLRRLGDWDRALRECGWKLVDAGRGSLVDQSRGIIDREPVLAVLFGSQALLDLVPRRLIRRLSTQVIGLYRAI